MLPSEKAEVTFKVTGAREMIPWLMSWGASVEVLEPLWLRKAVLSRLEQTLKVYG